MTPPVEVVPYDPAWPAAFEAERRLLAEAAGAALAAVEHIGSTAVPGLDAKPTIDILGVAPDLEAVLDRREALAAAGYEHRPGAFDDGEHLFFRKMHGGRRLAHLHVVSEASGLAGGYLAFRDWLRSDAEAAASYGAFKRALAARAPDRQSYVSEKERHVDGLLRSPSSSFTPRNWPSEVPDARSE